VNPARIADSDQLATAPFRLLNTPGHSPHHFAIAADGRLFAGEAAGVCLPFSNHDFYLRPATPPRFYLETSIASLDRLLALRPEILCYGHVGMRNDGMAMLTRHREQLTRWARTLTRMAAADGMQSAHFSEQWVDLLLAEDPMLRGYSRLVPEVQRRERYFLLNSVKGFAGYLAEKQQ